MTMLSTTATAPMATALSQTSAISSAGSPIISTCPIRRPSTVTATSRVSTGGAIRAVNQYGAASRSAAARPGGVTAIAEPAASLTTNRTWRIDCSCAGRDARNCSAGSSWRARWTASSTNKSARRIEAAISTRVCRRARKMTTLPATSTAMTSISTNASKSWARIERSYQSARHQRLSKVGACGEFANAAADCTLIGPSLWALPHYAADVSRT